MSAGSLGSDTEITWVALGPPVGWVEALEVDPTNAERLWAAGENGVFHSTDGGRTWKASWTGLPGDRVWALAIDPSLPSTVYAGSARDGVFKTIDAGSTWYPATSQVEANPWASVAAMAIAINPADPRVVYFLRDDHGIYRSSDRGTSWSFLSGVSPPSRFRDLAIDPANPSILWAVTSWNSNAVFKSTNGGTHWVATATGLPSTIYSVGCDPRGSSAAYALGSSNTGVLFKNGDGGKSWQGISPTTMYARSFALDHARPGTILLGRDLRPGQVPGAIQKSDDGGATWSSASAGLPEVSILHLATGRSDPKVMYAASLNRLFRSANGGASWSEAGWPAGPGASAVSVNPHDASGVLAITSGGVMVNSGPNEGWSRVYSDRRGIISVVAQPVSAGAFLGGTWAGEVMRRGDDGYFRGPVGELGKPIVAMVPDPTRPSRVYVGTDGGGVFKTDNCCVNTWDPSPTTWKAVNPGLADLRVTALLIDPGNSARLLAGTATGGIFSSTDAGEHWASASVGLATGKVTSLVADVTGIYAAILYGGVYRSRNGGSTWAAASGGLGGAGVLSLIADPVLPGTLYAGTESDGVFRSRDAGATWNPLGMGPAPLTMSGLAARHDTTGATIQVTLYAATPSGVYRRREERACAVTNVAPNAIRFAIGGGAAAVAVICNTAQCPWTASTDAEWITLETASGLGAGDTRFSVAANPGQSERTAAVKVGQQSLTVTQFGRGCSALDGPVLSAPPAAVSGTEFTLSWTLTSPSNTYEAQTSSSPSFAGAPTMTSSGLTANVSRIVSVPTTFYSRNRAVYRCGEQTLVSPWSNTVATIVHPRVEWFPIGPRGVPATDVEVDPRQHLNLWASLGGTVRRSLDGGLTWASTSGAAQELALDPTNSSVAYGITPDSITRTGDGGATWQAIVGGTTVTTSTMDAAKTYAETIAVQPGNPATLLLACKGRGGLPPPFNVPPSDGGLFRTTTSGGSWSKTNLDAPNNELTWVYTVAFDAANPTQAYATDHYRSFFRSTNSGATWARVTGFPHGDATVLAADPLVSATVYAGNKSLGTPWPGEIVRSTNGGSTWTKLYIAPTGASMTDVVIAPTTPRSIYGATDTAGVVRSADGGATWAPFNAGLTSLDVRALALDPVNPATVYAATAGGLFKYGTPCVTAVSPMSRWYPPAGGPGELAVTASEATCAWTAASNADWITVGGGAGAAAATAASGPGNATVAFSVAPNSGPLPRAGTLTVAGHTVTVAQDGFDLDASFTVASTSPRVGSPLQFSDTSAGSPAAWSWDFGDGTGSIAQHPSHAYAAAGTYTVTLTVSNAAGSDTAAQTVTVVECVLSCTALVNPSTGGAPLVSAFSSRVTATNCLAVPTILWDFGDGASSTEANPSHTYASVGEYPWALTVSADDKVCTQSGTVSVRPCTLTCSATVSPSPSAAPVNAAFASTVTAEYCAGQPVLEWTFGDGATSTEANPTHSYTAIGSYPWTLTVTVDGETCERTGTVEALGPACAGPYDLIVPAAAHANGVWQSDLDLLNIGEEPASVDIALLKSSVANLAPQAVNVEVPAGQTLRLPDILGGLLPASNGAVALRFCSGEVFATSRFYNIGSAATGTFGMAVPAMDVTQAITPARPGVFHNLSYSPDPKSGFRVNLGFVNASPFPVAMIIRLFGDAGELLGSKAFSLRAHAQLQWTKIHQLVGTPAVSHGWASVETTTAGAVVLAYAMLIDNLSQDPLSMPPELPAGGLPAVAAAAGQAATLEASLLAVPPCTGPYSLIVPAAANANNVWKSDLDLLNLGASEASVDIALLKTGQANLEPEVASVAVPAGQALRLPDILGTLLPASNAALALRFCAGEAFASSRFYNVGTAATGTFGMAVPGLAPGKAITPGTVGVFHLQSYSTDPKLGYRVNLGFANASPFPVNVVLKLYGDAGELLGTKPFSLRAHTQLQWTKIHQLMGTPAVAHGWATVEVTTPNALVHAYQMLIDNVSNDPALFEPDVVEKAP